MKKTVFFILLMFSINYTHGQTTKNDTTDKTYYFITEIFNEVLEKNNLIYPRPNVPLDSFFSVLYKNAHYPELAIKNNLTASVSLELNFDIDGKITGISLESDNNPLFDTAAIRLIVATKNLWSPCIDVTKKVEKKLDVAVQFQIVYKNEKLYYTIKPFINTVNLVTDSSSNHPALLSLKNEINVSETFINKKVFDASKILKYSGDYGTVSIGFDIDTDGSISEIMINNSVNSKLDSNAIEFIRSTNKQWIPAVKNGEKRPSHKEFDLMYYQVKEVGFTNPKYSFLAKKNRSDIADFDLAKKEFDKKDYKKAVTKLDLVCKYQLRNPEPFYYRGLTHLSIGNAEKGCEDIKNAQVLAEQYGYPLIMEKEKVMDFLRKSCGEE